MVVYGHTHRAAEETIGETLFLNPGYAGRPRFHDPRSVAFLHVHGPEIRPEFVQL
jgi:hypothetical protein